MTPPSTLKPESEIVAKAKSFRVMCEASDQPFYVEILGEIITGLERQASALQRAVEALEKIARLRTELSGDFSMASKQSDIAREALASLESGAREQMTSWVNEDGSAGGGIFPAQGPDFQPPEGFRKL